MFDPFDPFDRPRLAAAVLIAAGAAAVTLTGLAGVGAYALWTGALP